MVQHHNPYIISVAKSLAELAEQVCIQMQHTEQSPVGGVTIDVDASKGHKKYIQVLVKKA